jgi:CheY-like chemotaxis protein
MNTEMQSTAGVTSGPEADFSQSLVLIVDDNPQNVELLQAYLEALSCRTLTAGDGIEALKVIESPHCQKPDLILLDVMMPRMSGFELCRKLKEDPATRSIPVMMVTALNELGDIERGVESGTDDFLTKPINKLEFLTRVKSLLRVRHLKRELDRTMALLQQVETRPSSGVSTALSAGPGEMSPDESIEPGAGPMA